MATADNSLNLNEIGRPQALSSIHGKLNFSYQRAFTLLPTKAEGMTRITGGAHL
jgi:hypothetical protein